MSEEVVVDDSSHYEVSLTAGQAFVAFVLLLLSLAASFAFGLMIGKGQMDDRLVVRRTPAVVNEASVIPGRKSDARIVELGDGSDFHRDPIASPSEEPKVEEAVAAPAADAPIVTEELKPDSAKHSGPGSPVLEPVSNPTPAHEAAPKPAQDPSLVKVPAAAPPPAKATSISAAPPAVAHYAQVLSTSDVKTAEALAAKLIDRGFNSAYVERTMTVRGMVYRVRVRFGSEAEAREAVEGLHAITGSDVWVTK